MEWNLQVNLIWRQSSSRSCCGCSNRGTCGGHQLIRGQTKRRGRGYGFLRGGTEEVELHYYRHLTHDFGVMATGSVVGWCFHVCFGEWCLGFWGMELNGVRMRIRKPFDDLQAWRRRNIQCTGCTVYNFMQRIFLQIANYIYCKFLNAFLYKYLI